MKAYSEDLRQQVLAAVDSGMSRADAVSTFRISLSSIKRWCAQRTSLGHLCPKRSLGRPHTITRTLEPWLRLQLDSTPDATLPEHLETWSRARPLAFSLDPQPLDQAPGLVAKKSL